MLAYVFWHWSNHRNRDAEYEHLQRAFQSALAEAAPSGFRGSVVFRIQGSAPWLGGPPAYADWYLLDDSAALDPLNVAAVTGMCEHPHAQLAQAMAAGAGSLLTLRGEGPNAVVAHHATCLPKPTGMPYDMFYSTLAALPDSRHTSVWRRQMVLGPTPEFTLLSQSRLALPKPFQPLQLELTPIWTGR